MRMTCIRDVIKKKPTHTLQSMCNFIPHSFMAFQTCRIPAHKHTHTYAYCSTYLTKHRIVFKFQYIFIFPLIIHYTFQNSAYVVR